MIWAVYIGACALFYAGFVGLRVVARTRALLALFRDAGRIMADPGLSDAEKEVRIRTAAIGSLRQTLGLMLRLLAVLAGAASPILAAHYAAGPAFDDVMAVSLDPGVLICTVLVLVGLDVMRRRMAG